MKTCTSCSETFPISSFYMRVERRGRRSPHSWCRTCYIENMRWARMKNRYGITREEYEVRFAAQGGQCLICRENGEMNLAVDHDHDTGQICGLLCQRCNAGLGQFKDKSELLLRAAAYLSGSLKSPTT